jgi:hypothetical protein
LGNVVESACKFRHSSSKAKRPACSLLPGASKLGFDFSFGPGGRGSFTSRLVTREAFDKPDKRRWNPYGRKASRRDWTLP